MSWNFIALDNYSFDKEHLDCSNSVLLPPRVLEETSTCLDFFVYKMTAENGMSTYVGVEEFSAPDDMVIVPWWILEFLGIQTNSVVKFEKVDGVLPGKKVTLEPEEKEFFDIPDCEGCLETMLSNFSVLHINQKIRLNILNKNYHIKVVSVEPNYSTDERFTSKEEKKNNKNKKSVRKKNKKIKINKKKHIKIDTDKKVDKSVLSDVISIKNIDLEVDISNKFLIEELKRKQEEELKMKQEEEIKKQMEQLIKQEEIESKGIMLGGTKCNSLEELRQARIKRLGNK